MIGDGEVKILLEGAGGLPAIVEVNNMKFGDVRKALRAVTANQSMLMEEWNRIHG